MSYRLESRKGGRMCPDRNGHELENQSLKYCFFPEEDNCEKISLLRKDVKRNLEFKFSVSTSGHDRIISIRLTLHLKKMEQNYEAMVFKILKTPGIVLSKTFMLRKHPWIQAAHHICLCFGFAGLIHKNIIMFYWFKNCVVVLANNNPSCLCSLASNARGG